MPRCADHRHQRFPQSRRKPPGRWRRRFAAHQRRSGRLLYASRRTASVGCFARKQAVFRSGDLIRQKEFPPHLLSQTVGKPHDGVVQIILISSTMKLEIICLSLILFSSCASRKMSDRSVASSDSLRRTTRLSIRQMAVPESRADLQIPAAGLRGLPPAAVYTARSGQATATVRFLHDTLFVSASCDSCNNWSTTINNRSNDCPSVPNTKRRQKKGVGDGVFYGGFFLAVAAYLAGWSRYEMFK